MILYVINAIFLTALSMESFRILQSASYYPQRNYWKIITTKHFVYLLIAQVVVAFCGLFLPLFATTIALGLFAVATFFVKRKSPLKLTKRILRMIVLQTALFIMLCLFVCSWCWVALTPIITLISWAILLPLELLISNYYLQKAHKKVAKSGITVIAITGSYGKTSVKDMLAVLLDDAVAPQGSCNTPLGIARFVNGCSLSNYKYLILEFGARKVGDVRQLCKLYLPQYGIVTGLCPQHLATFKSFQNVVATKGELVVALPQKGVCVLNGADDNLKSFCQLGVCKKIYTAKKTDLGLKTTLKGAQFTLMESNLQYLVRLPQISNYIVDTFLMCVETCKTLGQDLSTTLANVGKVKQTPHRMELSFNGSFYILDDSYNANLKGVQSCCETLSMMDNYKIVLTQGIVEGGSDQKELNVLCGKMLAGAFDVVIAVGRYSQQILEGATCQNCIVAQADNLDIAVQKLQQYAKPNCIVLFQNDLPDVVNL